MIPSLVLGAAVRVLDPSATPEDPESDLLGQVVVDANSPDEAGLPPRLTLWLAAGDETAAALLPAVADDLERFGLYRVYVADVAALEGAEHGWRLTLRTQTEGVSSPQVRVWLASPARPEAVAYARLDARDDLDAHRVADAAIELLTGTLGPMTAPLAWVERTETRRAVEVTIGATRPERRSRNDEVVSTLAWTPDGTLVYAGSRAGEPYRVVPSRRAPVVRLGTPPETVRGAVYGLAFGSGHAFAMSVAVAGDIRVVTGRGESDPPATLRRGAMALQPTMAPNGRLAYVVAKGKRRRVDAGEDKPVSAAGVDAHSPTFCPHPDGLKLAWVEHRRGRDQIVVADGRGRSPEALGPAWRTITSIGCSPDGRLLAVIGTGPRGSGLFIGHVDRFDPRRLVETRGDTVRWGPRRE